MEILYIFLGAEALLLLFLASALIHDRRTYEFIIREKNRELAEKNLEIRQLRYVKLPDCCKTKPTVGYSRDPEWQRMHAGETKTDAE